jgi:hypothetical protein
MKPSYISASVWPVVSDPYAASSVLHLNFEIDPPHRQDVVSGYILLSHRIVVVISRGGGSENGALRNLHNHLLGDAICQKEKERKKNNRQKYSQCGKSVDIGEMRQPQIERRTHRDVATWQRWILPLNH